MSSMGLILDRLDAQNAPATFFLPNQTLRFYPNILSRADSLGEMGLTSQLSVQDACCGLETR